MAESDDYDSRTEPATQRRRDEAREQGRVAYSSELVGGLLLLASMILLTNLGGTLSGGLLDSVRIALPAAPPHDLGVGEAAEQLGRYYWAWLRITGAFLIGLLALGVTANVVQIGFHITPDRLGPEFDKLDPTEGLKRLFSLAALVKGTLAVLKVASLILLTYLVLRGRLTLLTTAGEGGLIHMVGQGWGLTMRLAVAAASVMFLLGVVDYIYQRQRFERSLRMTKQEIKEEAKREEGDPVLKARIRAIQREMARRRMMAAVPKATVVVTNPTHIAVALLYERGVNAAPRVVAKGSGFIAARIIELAREAGVPVVERRPLARALFKVAKIDQEIPEMLFHAVAELLAYLYRLRGTM
jgi:flagellar biosynthetic protein FlhB